MLLRSLCLLLIALLPLPLPAEEPLALASLHQALPSNKPNGGAMVFKLAVLTSVPQTFASHSGGFSTWDDALLFVRLDLERFWLGKK